MTTAEVQTSSQQETTPARQSLVTARQVQPANEPEVYWGDRLALKVWGYCFLLMWMMNIFDFLAGAWGR
jgi:hypothetical protein